LKNSCVRRHHPGYFATAATSFESAPVGGFGPGLLITGHRRQPSTP
jgi:hypothetical protein